MTARMTPTRLACLRFLRSHPGWLAPAMVRLAVPRPVTAGGIQLRWTAQGAARMGGKLAKDLERLGWATVDRYVDCGVAKLTLTEAGLRELQAHEFAEQHARDIECTVMFGRAP